MPEVCRLARAFKLLKEQIPDLTISEFDEWLGEGLIENLEIEGEIMVFRNFLPNLVRERSGVRSRLKAGDDSRIARMLCEHLDTVVHMATV